MFVTTEVSTAEKPLMMNRVASVTMNEGSLGSHDDDAVEHAEERRRDHRHHDRQPERQAPDRDADADDDAGEPDERTDRQVELARDHQQGDGRADDADLRGDVEVVERPGGRDEGEVALREADGREDQPDEDHDDQRPGRGTRQDPLGEREPSESFGSGCRPRLGRRGRHRSLRKRVREGPAQVPIPPMRRSAGARALGQRRPFAARAMTSAAFSPVTNPGPVMIRPVPSPVGRFRVSAQFVRMTIGR